MAYFTIEKSGCHAHKGLLQVRYDLFWDDKDPEYSLIEVPIYPDEGYTGEETEEAYQAWLESLPTQLINPGICGRIVYFNPSVTNSGILFVGELALIIAEQYRRQGKYRELYYKNMPFQFDESLTAQSLLRLNEILSIDFTKIPDSELYRVK